MTGGLTPDFRAKKLVFWSVKLNGKDSMRFSGGFAERSSSARRLRATSISAVVVVGALAAAGAASASTIAIDTGGTLRFTAARGEVNHVDARDTAPFGVMVVTDSGSRIHVGAGCTAVTADEARCDESQLTGFVLDLAGGDDFAHVFMFRDGAVAVNGGGGDDTIEDLPQSGAQVSGGRGDDTITVHPNFGGIVDAHGDAGDDSITAISASGVVDGDAGDDQITLHSFVEIAAGAGSAAYGGGGDDRISADVETFMDLIDGGGGFDRITTSQRATVFVIDGGPGPDIAITSANTFPMANTINSGPGRDHIDGGGGGDTIDCGPGLDTFVAYAGDIVHNCEFALPPPGSGV